MTALFTFPVRIYYEDTDAGGVVFYANYLNYYERARTELLRSMGVEQDALMRDLGIIFVVRSVQIDYLLPAKFNDLLAVTVAIKQLKSASLVFEQTIKCGDVLLNTASVRIACLDLDTLRPKLIPDYLKELLKLYSFQPSA